MISSSTIKIANLHTRPVRIRLLTLALKPRGDVTRSPKQGYQWPHKKDLCPPKIKKTGMHSSRMRTARLLPVSPSMHTAGGCLLWGVSAPGGVCSRGSRVFAWGGLSAPGGGCLLPGVSAPGGGCLLPGGCLLLEGVCIPACTEAGTPPNRMTKRCKNINFANFVCGGKKDYE